MKIQCASQTLEEILDQVRVYAISAALRQEGGNMGRAADRLSIHPNSLTRMVRRLNMAPCMTTAEKRKYWCKLPEASYANRKPVQSVVKDVSERKLA